MRKYHYFLHLETHVRADPEIILWGDGVDGTHFFVLRVEGSSKFYVLGIEGVVSGGTFGASWGWGVTQILTPPPPPKDNFWNSPYVCAVGPHFAPEHYSYYTMTVG
jgi:hypothetical protein